MRSLIFIGTGEFTPQTKKGRVLLVPGSGQRGFPWSCSVPWTEAGPSPWQGMQGEALAVLPCRAALPFGRLEPQGSVKEGMVHCQWVPPKSQAGFGDRRSPQLRSPEWIPDLL